MGGATRGAASALRATGATPVEGAGLAAAGRGPGRVCGRAGLRSANPGGGPAPGAERPAGGCGGASTLAVRCCGEGAGCAAVAVGACAPADVIHSRIFASSSGARPAKRICADGPPRTTRPQLWNAPHERRTVSPALSGSCEGASTPADETVAPSRRDEEPRAATATVAGAPPSCAKASPTDAARRATNWSFGMGMKSRSLAPARKHSSRCAACSRCSTATTRPPRPRSLGASACSAAVSGAPGAP